MSLKNCYVAKLGDGRTFLGALKSINRVARNLATHITRKAPSKSAEGEEMFVCACGKHRVLKTA